MSISLDSSCHAFKAVRAAPLSAAIPKKLFKSEAATSQQTHQKEKTTFLHFGVLRKRLRHRGEKQFANTFDQKTSFLICPT